MTAVTRHNVTIRGRADGPTALLGHGFGSDQTVWAKIVPALEQDYRVVLFDHVGSGGSDLAAFDRRRHAGLSGYVDDLLDLVHELELHQAIYLGHSISSAIGLIASVREPDLFSQLVLIGGSARYLDDGAYRGGFSPADVDAVLAAIDDNYLGWAGQMTPAIMNTPGRPELEDELQEQFSRLDPEAARTFARATFLADVRDVLPHVSVPTLILHCRDDAIVPDTAALYLRDHLVGSSFVQLSATGHCPLLSAPEQIVAALDQVLPVSVET